MGKKQWKHRELDVAYGDHSQMEGACYNAVEYKYPEIPSNKKFKHWDTKNAAKFREMFKKNKKNVNEDIKFQNGLVNESDSAKEVEQKEQLIIGKDSVEKPMKKIKKKKKNRESLEILVADEIDKTVKVKKKKSKGKKLTMEEKSSDEDNEKVIKNTSASSKTIKSEEVSTNEKSSKKLKRKKCLQPEEIHVCEKSGDEPPKKKKKKSKADLNHFSFNAVDETLTVQPGKDENNKVIDVLQDSSTEIKSKKKKKKSKSSVDELVSDTPNSVEVEKSVKRKKAKKKTKLNVNDSKSEVESMSANQKSEKQCESTTAPIKDQTHNDSEDSRNSKKKKKKNKKKSSIDELGNEHCSKDTSKGEDVVAGQWETASFDDSNKKDKFLRLMGGFKLAPSLSKNTDQPPCVKFNSALTGEREKKLNDGLEKQYNEAISLFTTKGKGSGLGFEKDPSEGKKFYIDIKKAKSKKFDDD